MSLHFFFSVYSSYQGRFYSLCASGKIFIGIMRVIFGLFMVPIKDLVSMENLYVLFWFDRAAFCQPACRDAMPTFIKALVNQHSFSPSWNRQVGFRNCSARSLRALKRCSVCSSETLWVDLVAMIRIFTLGKMLSQGRVLHLFLGDGLSIAVILFTSLW